MHTGNLSVPVMQVYIFVMPFWLLKIQTYVYYFKIALDQVNDLYTYKIVLLALLNVLLTLKMPYGH
jgi:hypothetical protein